MINKYVQYKGCPKSGARWRKFYNHTNTSPAFVTFAYVWRTGSSRFGVYLTRHGSIFFLSLQFSPLVKVSLVEYFWDPAAIYREVQGRRTKLTNSNIFGANFPFSVVFVDFSYFVVLSKSFFIQFSKLIFPVFRNDEKCRSMENWNTRKLRIEWLLQVLRITKIRVRVIEYNF